MTMATGGRLAMAGRHWAALLGWPHFIPNLHAAGGAACEGRGGCLDGNDKISLDIASQIIQ